MLILTKHNTGTTFLTPVESYIRPTKSMYNHTRTLPIAKLTIFQNNTLYVHAFVRIYSWNDSL